MAISVIILIALFLGWRESLVVAVAVPVRWPDACDELLHGYTLNRVTLFALSSPSVFSWMMPSSWWKTSAGISACARRPAVAAKAVDEVGNPTILATFTVIAALLPMAFVSGLMGFYMRPIPVGASAAMLFSLLVAFIVSPWLAYIVLKNTRRGRSDEEEKENSGGFYGKLVGPLIEAPKKRLIALASVAGLLLLALILIPLKLVTMKMLPFDNKSEFQVIIDMPEGRTLEETAAVTRALSEYLKTVPEVTDYQAYIGTAAPYNFNGLVRHYFPRRRQCRRHTGQSGFKVGS